MLIVTTPSKFMSHVFISLMSLCFFACAEQAVIAQATTTPVATATPTLKQAALAMPDTYSADVAKDILQKGGNAIDAAIAAQFVLAVTLPEAGNIGGGGFMLVYKDKKSDFIDYREQAPLSAHKDMYLDKNGDVIPYQSIIGVLSSGVPGTVAGMWLAHEKYGSLSWKELVQPAVTLAEQGFNVHPKLAESIQTYIQELETRGFEVNFKDYFAAAKANEVFQQLELADTLKRIRDEGRDGFYKGQTAKIISNFMRKKKA